MSLVTTFYTSRPWSWMGVLKFQMEKRGWREEWLQLLSEKFQEFRKQKQFHSRAAPKRVFKSEIGSMQTNLIEIGKYIKSKETQEWQKKAFAPLVGVVQTSESVFAAFYRLCPFLNTAFHKWARFDSKRSTKVCAANDVYNLLPVLKMVGAESAECSERDSNFKYAMKRHRSRSRSTK